MDEAVNLGLTPANGLDGGDKICQKLADDAGIGDSHSFKAWLSDETGSPSTRFSRTGGPYVRVGEPVRIADDFADLTDGSLDARIDRSETGGSATGQGFWTATAADGQLKNSNHCQNWSSVDGTGYLGFNDFYTEARWSEREETTCSSKLRLYCFAQ